MYFNLLMFYILNNISKKDLRQLKQKAFGVRIDFLRNVHRSNIRRNPLSSFEILHLNSNRTSKHQPINIEYRIALNWKHHLDLGIVRISRISYYSFLLKTDD